MDSEKYPIQRYIYDWLLEHESIIVPELGQFVAEFKGASIQPTATTSSMLPPNKTVIFNTEHREDDGVLTGFICQQENLPEEDVQSYLKQVVTELKIALASDQKYELPAFGTFSKNPIGEIEFTADENVNFEGDSFGLPKLFYKPVEKKEDVSFFDQLDVDEEPVTPQPAPETNHEVKDKEPVGFAAANDSKPENTYKKDHDDDDDDDFDDDDDDEPIKRKWLMPVMIILFAGILITAGIMYLPSMLGGGKTSKKDDKTDSSKIAKANTKKGDTNVITSTEVTLPDTNKSSKGSSSTTSSEKKETTKSENETKKEEPKTTTNTGSSNNTGSTTTTPSYTPPATTNPNAGSGIISSFAYRPQEPADLSTAMLSTPTSKYYIVLGGFGNKANAYSLYNNLKSRSYPAKIMAPTGGSSLHRVVIGAYDSEAEAENKRRGYTGTFGAKIWVTKY